MSENKREEMTPREAAMHLGVHVDTVRSWAKEAASGNGVQLTRVRVDACRKQRRYFVDAAEVRDLAARRPQDYA